MKGKYVLSYKELIMQLPIYMTAIRISAKGYLPISLITPLKLKEILSAVRNKVRKTNPDYDLVIKRLYYDMKLVTCGIDNDKKSDNTISCIHTAIHTTATNIIPNRNWSSSNHRSKYISTLFHISAGWQTIHCTKFRNLHCNKTVGTKNM